MKASVYVGNYSIDYIKGKRLVIKKIEKGEDGVIRALKRITIYDLFGFYQSSFVTVVDSLVPLGLATPEEVERIRSDKARRAEFHQVPLEEIKLYTTLELRMLSIAATVLRDGFDRMGIRLNSWMGAGAAASALLKKRELLDIMPVLFASTTFRKSSILRMPAFTARALNLANRGLATRLFSRTTRGARIPMFVFDCRA